MDILGHALYGVTLCSRTGLAGGRWGAPIARGRYDWTAWAAAGFALLPDMASIGVSFTQLLVRGASPSFHGIPPYVFVLYHFTHSLITAGLCVLLLRTIARPLVVPALAWPAHILIDTLLHDEGRWQTPMFFPFSDWHFHGINWWEHSNVVLVYWGIMPVLWLVIHLWRCRTRMTTAQ